MSWVRIEDTFSRHPKGIEIGPSGRDLFVCGLCYCNQYLTDGFILDSVLPQLAPGQRKPRPVAELLVKVGLWERVEGGYCVHDYLDYQPSSQQVKAQREAMLSYHSAGGRARAATAARLHGRFAPKGTTEQSTGEPTTKIAPADIPAGNQQAAGGDAGVTSGRSLTSSTSMSPAPSHPVLRTPIVPTSSTSRRKAVKEVPAGFSEFWSAYPKRVGKQEAMKEWVRLNPSVELQQSILQAIGKQKKSIKAWIEGDDAHILHPCRWLKHNHWEDEVTEARSGNGRALEDPPDPYANWPVRWVCSQCGEVHEVKKGEPKQCTRSHHASI